MGSISFEDEEDKIEPDYGLVTMTRRNRAEAPVAGEVSRTVTRSLGEPMRETSTACEVKLILGPEYVAISDQFARSEDAWTW